MLPDYAKAAFRSGRNMVSTIENPRRNCNKSGEPTMYKVIKKIVLPGAEEELEIGKFILDSNFDEKQVGRTYCLYRRLQNA